MVRVVALALTAGAVALTACGGGSGKGGEQLFTSNSCGSCHVLTAARTTGTVGPSLDGRNLTADAVRRVVQQGSTGMPGYADRITGRDLTVLADYVATASRAK